MGLWGRARGQVDVMGCGLRGLCQLGAAPAGGLPCAQRGMGHGALRCAGCWALWQRSTRVHRSPRGHGAQLGHAGRAMQL
jgi:hypothetical protein